MQFIETPIFTEELSSVLNDDEYNKLQVFLSDNPTAGDVIPDTGGLRKLRWAAKKKGKSGGARVIYYYLWADSQIRMLLIYAKGTKDDLTSKEKKILRQLNDSWG